MISLLPLASRLALLGLLSISAVLPAAFSQNARNPLIWADVPDIAVIRVGETYYMSSTTMHMSPGLPIMKSPDLVNWTTVGYAYDTLVDNPDLRLETDRAAYGQGSWASSLRYHDGVYYASTFSSTSGRTHIYTTRDIEKGPWKETTFSPSLHDHTLFFDDDGKVYMIYGGGRLTLVELQPDLSGIKPGGVNQVVVENVNAVFGADQGGLKGEGSQLFKIKGRYYLVNIASPGSRWSRTVIVHRADKITGPYEGKIVLQDRGIAQGGFIDTPKGDWYAYLFRDNGAVGRIPYLVPVRWADGWPVLGENGKAPMMIDIPAGAQGESGVSGVVASDEFHRAPGERPLPLAWQWNHNPVDSLWSLTDRPGHLRLSTGKLAPTFVRARNTLTQRTFGPRSVASTRVDVSALKDGDVAGLGVLQRNYGYVAVKQENGARHLVMVAAEKDAPVEHASIPLSADVVHLRADCAFQPSPELARFSYSLDGREWIPIGRPAPMSYTMPHFMGYRFALFCYATREAGGHADFDYYRVAPSPESASPRVATDLDGNPLPAAPGSNPIFRDAFTADPAPLVVGDTVYVYVGEDNAKGTEMFTMPAWLCYSSQDLKTWTAHGEVLRPTDFAWGEANSAWASQVVRQGDKFYFYVTARGDSSAPGNNIGVAVADSPLGPFKDALGRPLVTNAMTPDARRPWEDIDPTVLVDDDGTPWMSWGNGDCYLVKLKRNMVELDGPIQKITPPHFVEGPWLYKRGGLYYLVYASMIPPDGWEQISYATAEKITGPWTHRGRITGSAKNSFTIHPGVIEFKNQWYFFYHYAGMALDGEKGGLGRRAVCAEYLFHEPDGAIRPIAQTAAGLGVPPAP